MRHLGHLTYFIAIRRAYQFHLNTLSLYATFILFSFDGILTYGLEYKRTSPEKHNELTILLCLSCIYLYPVNISHSRYRSTLGIVKSPTAMLCEIQGGQCNTVPSPRHGL